MANRWDVEFIRGGGVATKSSACYAALDRESADRFTEETYLEEVERKAQYTGFLDCANIPQGEWKRCWVILCCDAIWCFDRSSPTVSDWLSFQDAKVIHLDTSTSCRALENNIFELFAVSTVHWFRASSTQMASVWMKHIYRRKLKNEPNALLELSEERIAQQAYDSAISEQSTSRNSLRELLKLTLFRDALIQFCSSSEKQNLVLFWMHVEVFRNACEGLVDGKPLSDMLEQARFVTEKERDDALYSFTVACYHASHIYIRFLTDRTQITRLLHPRSVQTVRNQLKDFQVFPNLFSELQQEVETHIETFIFPNFVRSRIYRNLMMQKQFAINWWQGCVESCRVGPPTAGAPYLPESLARDYFAEQQCEEDTEELTHTAASLQPTTCFTLPTPVHHIFLDKGILDAARSAQTFGWLRVAEDVGYDRLSAGVSNTVGQLRPARTAKNKSNTLSTRRMSGVLPLKANRQSIAILNTVDRETISLLDTPEKSRRKSMFKAFGLQNDTDSPSGPSVRSRLATFAGVGSDNNNNELRGNQDSSGNDSDVLHQDLLEEITREDQESDTNFLTWGRPQVSDYAVTGPDVGELSNGSDSIMNSSGLDAELGFSVSQMVPRWELIWCDIHYWKRSDFVDIHGHQSSLHQSMFKNDAILSAIRFVRKGLERRKKRSAIQDPFALTPLTILTTQGIDVAKHAFRQDAIVAALLIEEELSNMRVKNISIRQVQPLTSECSACSTQHSLCSWSNFGLFPRISTFGQCKQIEFIKKPIKYILRNPLRSGSMAPGSSALPLQSSEPPCAPAEKTAPTSNAKALSFPLPQKKVLHHGWIRCCWLEPSMIWKINGHENRIDQTFLDNAISETIQRLPHCTNVKQPHHKQTTPPAIILDSTRTISEYQQLDALHVFGKHQSLRLQFTTECQHAFHIGDSDEDYNVTFASLHCPKEVHYESTNSSDNNASSKQRKKYTSQVAKREIFASDSELFTPELWLRAYACVLNDGRLILLRRRPMFLSKPPTNHHHISQFVADIECEISDEKQQHVRPSAVPSHQVSRSFSQYVRRSSFVQSERRRTGSFDTQKVSRHHVVSSEVLTPCREQIISEEQMNFLRDHSWGNIGLLRALMIGRTTRVASPSHCIDITLPLGEFRLIPENEHEHQWMYGLQQSCYLSRSELERFELPHPELAVRRISRNPLLGKLPQTPPYFQFGISFPQTNTESESSSKNVFQLDTIKSASFGMIPPKLPPTQHLEVLLKTLSSPRLVSNLSNIVDYHHTILFQGWLWKRGRVNRGWKLRWVTLSSEGVLVYYKFDYKDESLIRKGTLELGNDRLVGLSARPLQFYDVQRNLFTAYGASRRRGDRMASIDEFARILNEQIAVDKPSTETTKSQSGFQSKLKRFASTFSGKRSSEDNTECAEQYGHPSNVFALDTTVSLGLRGQSAVTEQHIILNINCSSRTQRMATFIQQADLAMNLLPIGVTAGNNDADNLDIRESLIRDASSHSQEALRKVLLDNMIPVPFDLRVRNDQGVRTWHLVAPSFLEGARWMGEFSRFRRSQQLQRTAILTALKSPIPTTEDHLLQN